MSTEGRGNVMAHWGGAAHKFEYQNARKSVLFQNHDSAELIQGVQPFWRQLPIIEPCPNVYLADILISVITLNTAVMIVNY